MSAPEKPEAGHSFLGCREVGDEHNFTCELLCVTCGKTEAAHEPVQEQAGEPEEGDKCPHGYPPGFPDCCYPSGSVAVSEEGEPMLTIAEPSEQATVTPSPDAYAAAAMLQGDHTLRYAAERIQHAIDSREAKAKWKCKALPTNDPPIECDWPGCGCDPHVERVMAGLLECGWYGPKEASALAAREAPLRAERDVAINAAVKHGAEAARLESKLTEARAEIARLEQENAEFAAHEQQTHEILGAILGVDDSLEQCAKRLLLRAEAAERERDEAMEKAITSGANAAANGDPYYWPEIEAAIRAAFAAQDKGGDRG